MVLQTKFYLFKSKVSTLTSASKVLIHEYVNFSPPPRALMIFVWFFFYDVQTTIFKKVRIWSRRIFSYWHILNGFIWYPFFSPLIFLSLGDLCSTQLLSSIKLQNLTRWHLGEALDWNICLVRFSRQTWKQTFWPCV